MQVADRRTDQWTTNYTADGRRRAAENVFKVLVSQSGKLTTTTPHMDMDQSDHYYNTWTSPLQSLAPGWATDRDEFVK